MGRGEERFGRRGTPVDQEPTTCAIGEADPTDVRGLGAIGIDHAAEADVQAEAAQNSQLGG
jgi:hypothetical protein